jgi:hypothetical protein
MRRGKFCHVSGQGAQGAASLQERCAGAVKACIETMGELGGRRDSIGRMMLLVSKKALGEGNPAELHSIVEAHWPQGAAPATSITVVEGLPAGADVQADAFGIAE